MVHYKTALLKQFSFKNYYQFQLSYISNLIAKTISSLSLDFLTVCQYLKTMHHAYVG